MGRAETSVPLVHYEPEGDEKYVKESKTNRI